MKQGLSTHADVQPLEIEIKHLFGDTFEISATSNVVTAEIERNYSDSDEGDNETTIEFQYELFIATVHVSGYEELVAALIELKYTHGDEISLMRKGINNSENPEYVDYLSYVEVCKSEAKKFYKFN